MRYIDRIADGTPLYVPRAAMKAGSSWNDCGHGFSEPGIPGVGRSAPVPVLSDTMILWTIASVLGLLSNFVIGAMVLAFVDQHGEVFDWYGFRPCNLALAAALFCWPRMVVKRWRCH